MAPGTTIVTLTQKDRPLWIEANFKETQLAGVRGGEPVEIDVDAFPGKVFKGKVLSIFSATGASTALLPPDNATGNFTKVVQRIPVRIDLIPAEPGDGQYASMVDIQNLRLGMSVTATIDTTNGGDK
jgi:membrane fusion protein (multidrug efflux system)